MMSFQTKEWLSGKGTIIFLVFFVFSLISLFGPTREEEMNAARPETCRVVGTYVVYKGTRSSARGGNMHTSEHRIRVKSEAKAAVEECVVEVFRYWRIHAGDTLTLYRREDGELIDPLSNVILSSRWRSYAILAFFCMFAFCLNRYLHYRPLAAREKRDRDREIGAALLRDHSVTSSS